MKLRISNNLTLSDVSADLRRDIKDRLAFKNPAYFEAEKMGRWTGSLPKTLSF